MSQLAKTETLLALRGSEITKHEHHVSLPDIIRSSEPSLLKLSKENYDALYDFAVASASNYLKICFPNQIHLAPVMASDLIETRISWKAADLVNLFKFLRQRQDIKGLRVTGNVLLMPKFMELVSVYEEHRAQELEKFQMEEKGKRAEANRTLNPLAEDLAKKLRDKGFAPTGDEKLGKEMDATRAKNIDRRTPEQNHLDFFENNKKF